MDLCPESFVLTALLLLLSRQQSCHHAHWRLSPHDMIYLIENSTCICDECRCGIKQQLLLMSPPGILLPASSQRLWHAGKPYTVHRDLCVRAHVSCRGHAVEHWCFIRPSGLLVWKWTKSGVDFLGWQVAKT